jgi:beta-galactosidase
VDRKFVALADDHELRGDGADATRIVLRVTDEFDRIRPIANDPIVFELSGPGQIIGDNPLALTGGTGAIWIRAIEQPGTIVLRAKHPKLGMQQIEINVAAAAPEKA